MIQKFAFGGSFFDAILLGFQDFACIQIWVFKNPTVFKISMRNGRNFWYIQVHGRRIYYIFNFDGRKLWSKYNFHVRKFLDFFGGPSKGGQEGKEMTYVVTRGQAGQPRKCACVRARST